MTASARPLLYSELVDWYQLLDPPADHAADAARYRDVLARGVTGPCQTLLELGAGAGHNALHLKPHVQCTLTDVSHDMLGLSRALNPECEHLHGDMRTLRLGRLFDAVLVHDAVMYMTTAEDLRAAAQTAFLHTRPGGAALFEPDCVRETFHEEACLEQGEEGSRSLRCLMWTWDPEPSDDTYCVDFSFLLRDGPVMRSAQERHVEGLFSRAVWMRTLTEVGFEVEQVLAEDAHSAPELFLCRKPSAP